MDVDILSTINQVKAFIETEKGTFVGLLGFLLSELLVLKYFIFDVFPILTNYQYHILVIMYVITILIWYSMRRIPVPKNKITIGIANFNIVSIGNKDLSGESKFEVEREIAQYIFEALHFHKQNLKIEEFTHIINLPARVNVNYLNSKKWARRLKLNLMIWGQAKVEDEVLYIEPHFEFTKEPTNIFYQKFKYKLNNLEAFTIDLKQTAKPKDNFTIVMHYIIYIALMFEGIKHMQNKNFEKANEAYDLALEKISESTIQTKTLTDIRLAIFFFKGRNFHQWGNNLKKDTEKIAKYKEASYIFFERANIIKNKDFDYEEYLEHSLLYGIHMLVKEKDYVKALTELEEIKNQFKDPGEFLLIKASILQYTNNIDAKKLFTQGNKLTKKKSLASQKIGEYYYKRKDFKNAIKYFEEKLNENPKKLYDPELLDYEDHLFLAKSHLALKEYFKSQKEFVKAEIAEIKNIQKTKKMYE